MGKGNRSRVQRGLDKLDNPQNYTQQNNKTSKKWINTLIVVFIVGILVLSLMLSALSNSGSMLRSSAALKSDNYTVTGTMLSYFFHSQYSSFVNNYGSLISYIGLDTSVSLKAQECTMLEGGGTWFDYFMNTTESYVTELLRCCEYAKANGIALDEEELAEIDEAIEAMNSYAFESGYTLGGYITAMYGAGVKEKDIRSSMEIVLLANKAAVDASDKTELTITEDEIQTYYDENPASFLFADYLVKTFSTSMPTLDKDDFNTTQEYDAAYATASENYAKDKAEMLAQAQAYASLSGLDAFSNKLNDDLTAQYDGFYDDDETLTEAEREEKEQKAIQSALDAATVTDFAYQDPTAEDSDELAKWIFDANRKVGDIHLIEEEDEETGKYVAYVYCVTATAAREEYTTANVAYALFEAAETASATEAEALKTKLVADGVLTAEAFEAVIKAEDISTATTMENMLKGSFGYDAADEYVFAEGRKAGDCEVVNLGTDYVSVILYLGEGDVAWHASAKNGVLSEKMNAWYEEIGGIYTVNVNEKAQNKISA